MRSWPVENSELFDSFFIVFERLHPIRLNQGSVLSDHVTAIQLICDKYGCGKLLCLRHLLVSFKQGTFRYYLHNLIPCKGEADFDGLITIRQDTF
jgi:hypothetical protein